MPHEGDEDSLKKVEEALLRYAHTMHEYTLRLWAESRKRLEERVAGGDARKQPPSMGQATRRGQYKEHSTSASKDGTGAGDRARA